MNSLAIENLGFNALEPHEFGPLTHEAIKAFQRVIVKIKKQTTISWETCIQPMEEAAEKLHRVWNLVEHVNAVANTDAVRKVYEELLPAVTSFHTDIMQDEQIYAIYLTLHASDEYKTFSDAQQSLISHTIRDFKLAGVDLPPAQRAQFKELSQRLSALENKFANNVLDATEAWTYHITTQQRDLLDGLPKHAIEHAVQRAQKDNLPGWVLTLDQPCYLAVMTYATKRQLREEFYVAYTTRASDQGPQIGNWDNGPLIAEIMQIRQQLAHLAGYANYAEYSLVPKMASSVSQVRQFIADLLAKVKPKAQQEFANLSRYAKQQGCEHDLAPWDLTFYAEMLHKEKYDINQEDLRPYFPEPHVLTGLFKLAHRLFGLNITEIYRFSSWDPAVRMFKVTDARQHVYGHFYVDLYTREGKRGGAWMAECVSRMRFANGNLQTPVAYLNCNFGAPVGDKPGLLTHDDVITLFHEFGHTLHHILTQVDFYSVAGMNGVAWDAVELPSQFMENWGWEWDVIKEITAHVETGAPLPQAMYKQLLASKNFHSGLYLLRQLDFTLLDMLVHEHVSIDANSSARAISLELNETTRVIPLPAFNRLENSFSHIFAGGYAAGYYSYLWAAVLSCDAFDKFTQSGTLYFALGESFLTHILAKGGSRPAMDLYIAFAGSEPKVDALLRHHAIT